MTTAPARITRPGQRPADSRAARLIARLTSRITDRLLGTALAVAACDPPAALHAPLLVRMLVLGAAAIALAAATGPPVWLVVCIATLLLAYLLVTDAWTAGVTAPPGPPQTTPAMAAAAATAIAATAVCLVVALRSLRSPPG
ncbi:hypothetical protein ACWERI_13280 [Streptomyces collinus]